MAFDFSKLNIFAHDFKDIKSDDIIQMTKGDKKVKANKVRYVLLKKIGEVCQDVNVFVYPVADEIVKQALNEVVEG